MAHTACGKRNSNKQLHSRKVNSLTIRSWSLKVITYFPLARYLRKSWSGLFLTRNDPVLLIKLFSIAIKEPFVCHGDVHTYTSNSMETASDMTPTLVIPEESNFSLTSISLNMRGMPLRSVYPIDEYQQLLVIASAMFIYNFRAFWFLSLCASPGLRTDSLFLVLTFDYEVC